MRGPIRWSIVALTAASLAALPGAALPGAAFAGGSKVVVKIGRLGDTSQTAVLVNKFGRTFYMSTGDHNRRSSCYGSCSSVWKPVVASGRIVAGSGVNQKLLGTTRRRNGQRQVTYNRHPLYLYVQYPQTVGAYDGQGCDSSGNPLQPGEQAVWRALNARGQAVQRIEPFTLCESGY